ncbi:hypothetical protein ACVWZ4_001348 [Bradyrhizobium sp. USDA 4472]
MHSQLSAGVRTFVFILVAGEASASLVILCFAPHFKYAEVIGLM